MSSDTKLLGIQITVLQSVKKNKSWYIEMWSFIWRYNIKLYTWTNCHIVLTILYMYVHTIIWKSYVLRSYGMSYRIHVCVASFLIHIYVVIENSRICHLLHTLPYIVNKFWPVSACCSKGIHICTFLWVLCIQQKNNISILCIGHLLLKHMFFVCLRSIYAYSTYIHTVTVSILKYI